MRLERLGPFKVAHTSAGIDRFVRSIKATRSPKTKITGEPKWETKYLTKARSWPLERLPGFGYDVASLRRWNDHVDDGAMINVMQMLTPEGASKVAEICRNLEKSAQTNDYVVTRRLRRVQDSSVFLSSMIRDPEFLKLVSRAVGVPLIPHPYRDAAVQINYYYPSEGCLSDVPEKVAKWHVDGMDYVFTMLLTDRSEFEGGEFIYFRGPKTDFNANSHQHVERGRFETVGDTLFARGSHVYHAVTPVIKGMRITLVISLFCPYFASYDGNRFWHSAPDDGLAHVLRTWLQFKRPGVRPSTYARMVSAPLISWEEINSTESCSSSMARTS